MTTSAILWLGQVHFFTSLAFLAVFLALELGLAWLLCVLRLRALSGDAAGQQAQAAYRYWVRIFALVAVLAFAAGLPVLIQSGTVWPGLIPATADVTVPLIAAAAISVFAFKSCFLGAMLFGQQRLAGPVHALVVWMVAVGTTVWAFWLLVLFSWLHTPTGALWLENTYYVMQWREVVFNPALGWYALAFGAVSVVCTATLLLAVSVAQAQRRPPEPMTAMMCRLALWLLMAGAVLVVWAADGVGQLSAHYMPARAAAAVGYVDSAAAPDLPLLTWPGASDGEARRGWVWPGAGGRWLGRDDGGWRGLDEFTGMTPPAMLVFWAVRACALAVLLLVLTSLWLGWRLRRAGFDGGQLSSVSRQVPRLMLLAGLVLLVSGLGYLHFGALPYAVQGSVTMQEVAGNHDGGTLLAVYLCHVVLYLVLLLGFLQLLRHGIRYGFVPVARVRRAAA